MRHAARCALNSRLMDSLVMVLLSTGVLLLRAGMMLYTSGLSRSKNAASTAARSLFDVGVAGIAFWAIGSATAMYRGSSILGADVRRFIGWDDTRPADTFALLCLVLIPAGVAVGSTIERSRLWPGLALSVVISALVMPVTLQWTLTGWLAGIGFIDSGGGTLHLVGGMSALVAAWLVGPRSGKYNRDGSANFIPGHNALFAVAGAMLMLAAWVPKVALMAALQEIVIAQIALRVVVSGAAAVVAGLLVSQLRYGKPDLMLVMSALLGGLVAIAPGAAYLSSPASFVIGAVAGVIVPTAILFIDLRLRIDDPAAAVAIHGVCGIWGLIGTGLLIRAPISDRLQQLGVQALGVAVITAIAILLSGLTLLTLRAVTGLRSKEADEFDGLDLAEHDLNAYPDFQQTMIKSYHLREA